VSRAPAAAAPHPPTCPPAHPPTQASLRGGDADAAIQFHSLTACPPHQPGERQNLWIAASASPPRNDGGKGRVENPTRLWQVFPSLASLPIPGTGALVADAIRGNREKKFKRPEQPQGRDFTAFPGPRKAAARKLHLVKLLPLHTTCSSFTPLHA